MKHTSSEDSTTHDISPFPEARIRRDHTVRSPRPIALQRTHSLQELYDADTASLDGEWGISPSPDVYQAGTTLPTTRSRSRADSASRLPFAKGNKNRVGPLETSTMLYRQPGRHGRLAETIEDHKERDVEEKVRPLVPSDGIRHIHEGLATADATHQTDTASSHTVSSLTDLEKQQNNTSTDKSDSASVPKEASTDPNLVTWDSVDSQENPRNWPQRKKWSCMLLVSSFTFFSPLSSSMIAPALPLIARELNITSSVAQNLTLSIFILAYAVGPLFLGPLSEIVGRRPVIQYSNLFFIAFSIACAVAQTQGQLTAFRFLSGLGGSAPLTTGGSTVGDLFAPEQRGKAMAVYSLAPMLGPVIGPIAGAAVTEYIGSFRWIFGILTIASAIPAVLGVFLLQETYGPRILAKKCARLRAETGNEKLHTPYQIDALPWKLRIKTTFLRPFLLLFTQPIVILVALYLSLVYGITYLYLTSFNPIFERQYNESIFIASLNYISLGLGFTAGAQFGGRLLDRVYKRLKAKNEGKGIPEFKLPVMMGGSFLIPIGLVLFGFSVQHQVFWLVPNIGAAIFAIGMMSVFLCLQNYIVDFYSVYAASALSAVAFCRSLCGFALPLAAPSLYAKLGYDYGNLLLAGLSALLGIPAAFLFYRYGPWLRARSPYASS